MDKGAKKMNEVISNHFLEDYRNGYRGKMTISLALRDMRMTKNEIKDILTGNYAEKIGYRRALRHPNAPKALVKKLSKDGEFLHTKCEVCSWDEATPEELHAGAIWLCMESKDSYELELYAKNPNTGTKTLKYLCNNGEDTDLWKALLLNPNTPDDVCMELRKRLNQLEIREIDAEIEKLKEKQKELSQANSLHT